MFISKNLYQKTAAIVFKLVCLSNLIFGQQPTGTLRGQISDQQNAVIVGATVEAIDANGNTKTAVTDAGGNFVLNNLAAGKYTVRASQTGFSVYENTEINIAANAHRQLNITLEIAVATETVIIAASNGVSTEPDNNGGAIVLKDKDLDALPDNPEDLEAALQSLAGSSAGKSGAQIRIDGFTDGRMPPKSSIREISVNQNPFSAEFERVGFGRIEISTKPGTNAFRGGAFFNFNDESLNSRNPFAPNRASYQSRQAGGNLSGSFFKKVSFFVDFERRAIDDLAMINASVLDANYNVAPFSQSVSMPLRRTSFSPRVDYRLNANNTLTARYGFTRKSDENAGIGGFSLASRAYGTSATEHNLQLIETAIINDSIASETRFQFLSRKSENSNGDALTPTVQVLDAFTSGGSSVGDSMNDTKRWELANNTSFAIGKHGLKIGARLRGISINDVSPNNFAGTYTFTSLEQYRNVLLGIAGATPTQLTITAGNAQAKISQIDFAQYIQDDWRVRPNLTLNFGLRYEAQTNVANNRNFAPRLGFAWSPDYKNGKNGRTVVRGGFGVFYDRIGEALSLDANRYNGRNLQSFVVTDPLLLALYPNIPTIDTLLSYATTQNTYRLADDIRAPFNVQTSIGVERQMPYKFTFAANYIITRGFYQLRVRNINAPVGYVYGDAASGTRPFGAVGNIFQYESGGRFSQNELMLNLRNNFNGKFSIFVMYTLGKATSDTEGANSFPANSYDLSGETARSSRDIRQRLILGSSINASLGLTLNPFVYISSGQPFNITTGLDTNGDSLFTERPTYAQLAARCGTLGLTDSFCDIGGAPDANATIPRNYGTGSAFATVNLRVSRTFVFGGESSTGSGNSGRAGSPSKKYNLTFSLNALNLFNNTNLGTPVGNLSSPLFGTSNSLADSTAYNRRLEAQVRFSF